MSWPSKKIRPAVGSSSLRMQRASVDLPHPDSPTIPSVSPSRSVKETPSTAFTVATCFWKMIPRVIGKCFFRSSTTRSSSPALHPGSSRGRSRAVSVATSTRRLTCLRLLVEVASLLVRRVDPRRASRGSLLAQTGIA